MTQTQKTYFPNSHAFIVGINDYQQVSKLRTAVNDAERLAQELESKHGYTTHLLLNPNRASLEEFISKKMTSTIQKDDRVIFYFAGHGIAVDAEDDKDGQPQGYLVPVDADPSEVSTFVPMQLLNDQLHTLKSRHLLLILDCCFSGSFEWSSQRTRFLGTQIPKKIYQERFDRYIQDPAWQVITSSAHDQKALDVLAKRAVGERGEEQGKHSPFALSLFEALDGKADVIPAEAVDGVITASELYIYLRDQVERQSISEAEKLRQTPKFFNLERHDKGEFIFFHPTHPLNLDPIPKRNPYKGLQSFNEEDADLFYGRDRVIKDLQVKAKQSNFLVITGASGTGKSSVIKAGLIPSLREAGYNILPVMRPNKKPLDALNECLLQGKVIEQAENFEQGIPKTIIQKLLASKTLLLIDQYEELITQCEEESDRDTFIDFLRQLLEADNAKNIQLVITVRADFEPQFEKRGLEKHWSQARFTIPPFSLEELMEVIEKPAIQEVLLFDPPELVNEIANEVIQAPGALPLLSFLLSELYLKCYSKGRSLTREAYQELGGVIGSLRTSADTLYKGLDDAHRQTMRQVMLRMVSIEGGEMASRRVFMEEFNYSEAKQNEQVKSVLDQLLAARLIVQGKDSRGKIYVEPAHDALVRAWATLWEWLKQFGEENILLQRRLYEAAEDVQKLRPEVLEKDKKVSLKAQSEVLWEEDPRLGYLGDTIKSKDNWLNALETNFVQASQNLKETLKKRRKRELVGAFSILGVLLMAAIGAAIFAFIQLNEAERGRKLVEQRVFVNDMAVLSLEIPRKYPMLKLRMLNQAQEEMNKNDSTEFVSIEWGAYELGNLVKGYSELRATVPVDKNGSSVEETSFKDLLNSINFNFEEKWDDFQDESIQEVFLSPDRNYMLCFNGDPNRGYFDNRHLNLWNLKTGNRIGVIESDSEEEFFTDVVFLPDGEKFMIGSNTGEIKQYSLKKLEEVFNADEDINKAEIPNDLPDDLDGPISLAVSPDGKSLYVSSTKRNVFWDIKARKIIFSETLPDDVGVTTYVKAKFSANGKHLLLFSSSEIYKSGSFAPNTNKFVAIDLVNQKSSSDFENLSLKEVVISPNGNFVLGLSTSNEVILWDVPNESIIETFELEDSVERIVFAPDNNHFFVQYLDNGVQAYKMVNNGYGYEILQGALILGAISEDGKALMIENANNHPYLFLWENAKKTDYLGTE